MKKYYLLIAALLLFFNMQGYGQQQEPQFIMPLIFIDANNDSDTLWLGYDPDASIYLNVLDTNLGETVQWIDTTKFHVYWYQYIDGCIYPGPTYPIMTDTVGKVSIWGRGLEAPGYVGFVNGEMPMTIKWVDSLLNVQNIPFPPLNPPRPRARIDIYNDGLPTGPCPLELPYVLSGFLKPFEIDGYCELGCCAKDSLYLDGLLGWGPSVMYLQINVTSHNAPVIGGGVDEYVPGEFVEISPNPFSDSFTVSMDKSCLINIYNAYGKFIYSTQLEKKEELNISCLSEYPSGIYFIHFKTKSNLLTKKIIKL